MKAEKLSYIESKIIGLKAKRSRQKNVAVTAEVPDLISHTNISVAIFG